ncbi:hypothetical protein FP568_15675 [Pandoraea pnomenusa]|uniref:P22 phage major capsid protein family protein n=1 Tax=Pandoraea pnomenusa TaxID=93220 RepID=UPI001198A113|nr:P22 phage major capsid protein family protein [Pandoraea pnomenusa]QDX22552.1 hypothetical protein FP568_15675 [Pandoraea pnomenusa]
MANTLLTPLMITREALRVLHQKLNFVARVERQYDDRFAQRGAKIGTTLNIRKPPRYTTSTGPNLSIQDSTETFVPLTVSTQRHVDLSFSSVELTMQIDDFSKRFIEPAMAQLAASIENDALSMYKDIWSQVGSPTAPTNALRPFLQAKKRMDDNLTPMGDERHIILNTDSEVEVVDALKGLFGNQLVAYQPTAEVCRRLGLVRLIGGKNASRYFDSFAGRGAAEPFASFARIGGAAEQPAPRTGFGPADSS